MLPCRLFRGFAGSICPLKIRAAAEHAVVHQQAAVAVAHRAERNLRELLGRGQRVPRAAHLRADQLLHFAGDAAERLSRGGKHAAAFRVGMNARAYVRARGEQVAMQPFLARRLALRAVVQRRKIDLHDIVRREVVVGQPARRTEHGCFVQPHGDIAPRTLHKPFVHEPDAAGNDCLA
ncbi:hypothetical protein SDC9_155282 [bioreactor metagenome]|uniref:Uncharacterized protein n=1 Tax=bioreactor metagenome TaxID=1076179 RepID=A0A645F309_9ZZZZ